MNTKLGWSPLWSSIVSSSLWDEDKDVRLLFLTMLAVKDANGIVLAKSPSGLARMANLTLDETIVAIKVLEAPDTKTTQTQEFEGRRIKPLPDGTGWEILNHFKYRDATKIMARNSYQADWIAKKRAKEAEAAKLASQNNKKGKK